MQELPLLCFLTHEEYQKKIITQSTGVGRKAFPSSVSEAKFLFPALVLDVDEARKWRQLSLHDTAELSLTASSAAWKGFATIKA